MSELKDRLLLRDTRCVGQYFLTEEDRVWALALPIGTRVHIMHEADNEHDPLAAVCYVEGKKIGYLPKESSPVACLFLHGGGHYAVYGIIKDFATKGQKNPLLNVFVETA